MKLSEENMKKAELRKTIENLWSNDSAPGDIKSFRNCLRKNKDILQEIYYKDPAVLLFLYGSEVTRILEASEVSTALPPAESTAVSKKQIAGGFENLRRRPVTTLISFFTTNRIPAISAAAVLMLLGVVFIYRSLALRQESALDSTQGNSTAEGLNKNQIYDNDIRRETAANAHIRADSELIAKKSEKDLKTFSNAIATNLLADGNKIIHYKMESGTEIIFVTGLD
jgi:hypothetical protein